MTLPILRAIIALMLASTALKTDSKPTPTPPPIPVEIPTELIEEFRITGYEVGTIGQWSMNAYIMRESEAMILTRVALGESQDSFEDRVAIMWLIKMRAELGFKWAGRMGYLRQGQSDRWGPPSTIAAESICVGGCQFSVMQPIEYITGPQKIATTSPMRLMLHPTDEQLPVFYETYLAALEIVELPLTAMPRWLQGYDSFRAVWIDQGDIYRSGGLETIQFFDQGDVWSDRWSQDNRYFDLHYVEVTPTPTITATLEPTSTSVPIATSTIVPILFEEPQARIENTKESDMIQEPWATLLFLLVVPLLIQGYKIWREKAGANPPAYAIQAILFGVSFVFIFFNEGVLGWSLPVWSGDLVGFVSAWAKMISSLFALTMALYEVVYKAVLEKIKFATKIALATLMLLFR